MGLDRKYEKPLISTNLSFSSKSEQWQDLCTMVKVALGATGLIHPCKEHGMSTDVNSISSSSVSASYNSAASSASTQPVKPPHHHQKDGDGEKMMGDVKSALSSLGVNVDTSNADTKSALSSFMHTLMGTLRGTSGGKPDNDNDSDDQAGAVQVAAPQSDRDGNSVKQGLDSLISALSSGNSTDPALSKLQDQFNSIIGASSSQGGNKVSLQDFLTEFGNKLPQEPPTNGYMVDTTA
jgi:hypothetical protein